MSICKIIFALQAVCDARQSERTLKATLRDQGITSAPDLTAYDEEELAPPTVLLCEQINFWRKNTKYPFQTRTDAM